MSAIQSFIEFDTHPLFKNTDLTVRKEPAAAEAIKPAEKTPSGAILSHFFYTPSSSSSSSSVS